MQRDAARERFAASVFAVADDGVTEHLFARDALRIAIATERSGMEFYGRGVKLVKDPRAREIFRKLATEEVHHLKKLESAVRLNALSDTQHRSSAM